MSGAYNRQPLPGKYQRYKLDRLELGRLLMDNHHNDILLVEHIDRLTRMSNSDWMTLKNKITTRVANCRPRCPYILAGIVGERLSAG